MTEPARTTWRTNPLPDYILLEYRVGPGEPLGSYRESKTSLATWTALAAVGHPP